MTEFAKKDSQISADVSQKFPLLLILHGIITNALASARKNENIGLHSGFWSCRSAGISALWIT